MKSIMAVSPNGTGEHGDSHLASIELSNVSKRFRRASLARKSYDTLKTRILDGLFRRSGGKENFFCALDDITVRVRSGESLGVIGRNGSGKSTLLKLISGIYQPDKGSVSVKGRISALIELGAGFHPDFTGRENIYLGGVMYGLSRKEIDERFSDIVRYAELEEFIDNPVRTYSSGMYMRLGFSLAIHTDPDVLLVDEVLSVGDAAFVHRCHETISDFRKKGKTLIFVTHDLESVLRWCDEAIWLEKGVVRSRGEPRQVIDKYLMAIEEQETKELESTNRDVAGELEKATEGAFSTESIVNGENPKGGSTDETPRDFHAAAVGRWGNREVEVAEVKMLDASLSPKWLFHADEKVTVEVSYKYNQPVDDLVFGIGILRADGLCIFGTNTKLENIDVLRDESLEAQDGVASGGGLFTFKFILERLSLLDDTYFLDVAAHRGDGYPYDYHHCLHKFSVRSHTKYHGIFNPLHRWVF
ncbi:MAG: ABC transporter ATP-binding protein [Deltaproteobacteria bacterium]|nr:ABC transporter ATP-binding protein [Deltaproteobacteria bacterium]